MAQPNAELSGIRSERVGGYIKNKARINFNDRGQMLSLNERRELAWKLVKSGIGSQDDQARATGLTVSTIANYRRLWKVIVRNHRHEVAHAMTAKQAYVFAHESGIGKFR
ncbi:hypothetical protein [Brucella anthropi]|uniref:Uncharacterized protein n=1 Tax=Brucella anthropi TaxID=529 RepID=A0A6L3Z3Z9_BRUAN|nr:hypothetical protein [Brucella anthropi]KAB2767624.1 hypothetical protein F9L04_14975 [Brucella anthropi]UVV66953.1 hypothetical protein NW321_10750 [Brucella anthropi]